MSEKYKITLLLIAVLSLGTFFLSIGNEIALEELKRQNEILVGAIDSLRWDLVYTNKKIEILEALR